MGVCASHDSCLQQIQAQTPRESNSKASAPRPCPDDRGTPTLCLCTSPINQVGPVPVHWAPKNSTAPGDCGTRWTLTVMVLPSGSPWVCSSSDLSLQSSSSETASSDVQPNFPWQRGPSRCNRTSARNHSLERHVAQLFKSKQSHVQLKHEDGHRILGEVVTSSPNDKWHEAVSWIQQRELCATRRRQNPSRCPSFVPRRTESKQSGSARTRRAR